MFKECDRRMDGISEAFHRYWALRGAPALDHMWCFALGQDQAYAWTVHVREQLLLITYEPYSLVTGAGGLLSIVHDHSFSLANDLLNMLLPPRP